jgi:antitoxin component YwqK of YwqJK toxin-antitoxin module
VVLGSIALLRSLPLVLAVGLQGLVAGCGPKTLVHPDGTPRAEGPQSWFDHREVGFWTFTYPNGALREQGRYADGHRVGVWEQWFPNGERRSRGERRYHPRTTASEREGMWILWHENGQRSASGTYRAGKREGHWDFSHPDGGLDGDRTGEYHDDVKLD